MGPAPLQLRARTYKTAFPETAANIAHLTRLCAKAHLSTLPPVHTTTCPHYHFHYHHHTHTHSKRTSARNVSRDSRSRCAERVDAVTTAAASYLSSSTRPQLAATTARTSASSSCCGASPARRRGVCESVWKCGWLNPVRRLKVAQHLAAQQTQSNLGRRVVDAQQQQQDHATHFDHIGHSVRALPCAVLLLLVQFSLKHGLGFPVQISLKHKKYLHVLLPCAYLSTNIHARINPQYAHPLPLPGAPLGMYVRRRRWRSRDSRQQGGDTDTCRC